MGAFKKIAAEMAEHGSHEDYLESIILSLQEKNRITYARMLEAQRLATTYSNLAARLESRLLVHGVNLAEDQEVMTRAYEADKEAEELAKNTKF